MKPYAKNEFNLFRHFDATLRFVTDEHRDIAHTSTVQTTGRMPQTGDSGSGLFLGNVLQLHDRSFLSRDVNNYISRAYATMSVSVCLSVTEVHWRIIAN